MEKEKIEVGWEEKGQKGGDGDEVTFSHFLCNSQMESIYSEVYEARKFPLRLQCPGALSVLSNKNSDSSMIEKP